MTNLEFKYDLDKDVDNFIAGTRARNNALPTKLQQSYIDKHGPNYTENMVRKFLESFISQTGLDTTKSLESINQNWRKIEKPFIARMEQIFNISYPASKITTYLTTNQRCTYNIQDNYFFVYFASKFTNGIIMHELFHFYTWHAFHDELTEVGVDENQYNDLKESLTELLNIEFVDLMEGAHDQGYPQHTNMRKTVRETWNETKNIKKVVASCLKDKRDLRLA